MKACIDQTKANRLIAALPAAERQRLLADAEFGEMAVQDLLGTAGKPLVNAYFPTDGMISLLTPSTHGRSLEVGVIGFEGMLGAGGALGVRPSVFDAVVEGAGHAWRIDVRALALQVSPGGALGRLLIRYLHVQLDQLGRRTVCSRFHTLPERLCRWLLMSQDRQRSPDLLVTHDALSHVLGARRAGITIAAGLLQEQGTIRYSRGHILVIDRPALLAGSCGCYAQDLATYERIMGGTPR